MENNEIVISDSIKKVKEKKKSNPKTKEKFKLPERLITHTIKNTDIVIEYNGKNIKKDSHEFLIGECCRYINCNFIINLDGDNSILFDECIFINCTIQCKEHLLSGNIDLEIIASDIYDLKFKESKFNDISFKCCFVNWLTNDTSASLRSESILFHRCYSLEYIILKSLEASTVVLHDNMNYLEVDLSEARVDTIAIHDTHLLSYWGDNIKCNNDNIEYERIFSGYVKKKK